MNFDAIIIGGGLGGLTAGATLSRWGKKVLLLEQHYIPGGCATTFKRKDYVMEVGLHELSGLHDADFKCGVFDALDIWENVEFIQAPELFRIKSTDFDVVFPHGNDAIIKAFSKRYPEDEDGIRRLCEMMEGVMREMPNLPKGFKAILLYPLFPFLYPNITEASRYTVAEWLDKHIKSEELKIILQINLMYFHDDPRTMSMFYFSAGQSGYFGGGGHFIKGGSQKLSNYLASEIKRGGGQVLLGKMVKRILVEDKKVIGVEFEDKFNSSLPAKQVFAPFTIANAAVPLVKGMLPREQASELEEEIDDLENGCSLLSVYLGFDKDLKNLGVENYSTIILDDYVKSLEDFGELSISADWEKKPFVFVDYSQIDAGLTPPGKTFGVICVVDYLKHWQGLNPKEYDAEKERVANVLLRRLDKNIPGIVEHIEHMEIGTAKTIQKYTLNPNGTPYGYAQTIAQAGTKRVQRKSPIENLRFASAWSMPGGGFPGAMISGFMCAVEVNNELGDEKVDVSKIEDERIVPLIERKEIAERTFEMVFEKPEGFDYKAGQYAIVSLNDPKYTKLDLPHRRLSMVSHPSESHLRFAMRTSASSFKRSCLEMGVGETATIYGPAGDFVIRPTGKPVVFLIAGIGVTPVPPILKELEKTNFAECIHLFYTNFTVEQCPYHQDFLNIDISKFHYHPVFSDTDGLMNIETLRPLGDLKEYDYYIVGTTGFLNAMEEILLKSDVPEDQIVTDDFG